MGGFRALARQQRSHASRYPRRAPARGERRRPVAGPRRDHGQSPGPASAPRAGHGAARQRRQRRSEEHTSELQSLMRISYAVFCLKKKKTTRSDSPSERQTAKTRMKKAKVRTSDTNTKPERRKNIEKKKQQTR